MLPGVNCRPAGTDFFMKFIALLAKRAHSAQHDFQAVSLLFGVMPKVAVRFPRVFSLHHPAVLIVVPSGDESPSLCF
jgi:hypothetical protein